jgi:hypothetical protein
MAASLSEPRSKPKRLGSPRPGPGHRLRNADPQLLKVQSWIALQRNPSVDCGDSRDDRIIQQGALRQRAPPQIQAER